MKKMKVFILISLILSGLTSCLETPTPYGVWVSEDPYFILYIDSAYQSSAIFNHASRSTIYPGLHIEDENETKVFFSLDSLNPSFRMYNIVALSKDGRVVSNEHNRLLTGFWEATENQIHYTHHWRDQERTGQEVIIFNKLEEYEPINPEDWFK
jgi:hypothetical protein